jgi:hypothetical protein
MSSRASILRSRWVAAGSDQQETHNLRRIWKKRAPVPGRKGCPKEPRAEVRDGGKNYK